MRSARNGSPAMEVSEAYKMKMFSSSKKSRKFRLWSERPSKRNRTKIQTLVAQRLQVSISVQDLPKEASGEQNKLAKQQSESMESLANEEDSVEDNSVDVFAADGRTETENSDRRRSSLPQAPSTLFERYLSSSTADNDSSLDFSGHFPIGSLMPGTHSFRKKFAPTASCFVCKEQFGLSRAVKCKKCRVKVHVSCKDNIGSNTCGFADTLRKLLSWAQSWENKDSILNGASSTAPEDLQLSENASIIQERTSATDELIEFALQDSGSEGRVQWRKGVSRQENSLDKCRKYSLQMVAGQQTSMEWAKESWDDVTIPLEDIDFRDDSSLIGVGRFGEVHRGYYHMDVAVKLLNMDHVEMENQLDTFRQDVRSFMSTRHDNIVLLIGCCLVPPYLGIVMNYCKGPSLFELVHDSRKWEIVSQTTFIAMAIQICQGMSYLHCKKILHKDLRTKNIFLQPKNRIVITDFGIFGSKRLFTKLQYARGCVNILLPQYWLQYQAPEIIRSLNAPTEFIHNVEELNFSEASDVFSFGCVWYELSTSEFPYDDQPHPLMWRVGNGLNLPLGHSRLNSDDVHILSNCWQLHSENRPRFTDISDWCSKMIRKSKLRGGRSLPTSP